MREAQSPAQGIWMQEGFDDATIFDVGCSCTDPEHQITVWVEVDTEFDTAVQVTFYTSQTYRGWKGFWERLRDAAGIVMGKPLLRQHSLLLEKQTAYNFAAALKNTVDELDDKFKRNDAKAD